MLTPLWCVCVFRNKINARVLWELGEELSLISFKNLAVGQVSRPSYLRQWIS